MCLTILLFSLLCISTTLAEAPYPAAGWRPQRPFHLPSDYLPPTRETERQQQPAYVVEINKQRVEFAGQLKTENPSAPNRQPANAYLPPSKQYPGFFKVQRPPYQEPAPQFVFETVGPRPRNEQKTKIFQILNTQKPREFGVRQESAISQPALTYGTPRDERKFKIYYPDPRSVEPQEEDEDEVDEGARIAIEALNAARDAYNRQQADLNIGNNNDEEEGGAAEAEVQEVNGDGEKRTNDGYPAARATRGQYYVLGPDNRFQLVRFTTSQSEEEAQKNGGFSANLRYIPVGEINDPVFRYDRRGQLVRVFKK